jgi:hypothetical protein
MRSRRARTNPLQASSVAPVADVLKQGRCSLVTTVQVRALECPPQYQPAPRHTRLGSPTQHASAPRPCGRR